MILPLSFVRFIGISRLKAAVLVLTGLALMGGCAATRPRPIPGLPPAYKVLGSWYQPISDAEGFKQRGIASWYGPTFHGKKTANGEIYDMHAMTAAHTILPLGTRVRVRNLSNNKEVVVRINDRGPFVKERIIDLSFAAAKALGLVGKGTARVEVTALSKAANPTAPVNSTHYTLQVGSFDKKANAQALVTVLSKKHDQVYLFPEHKVYKVRVGRFSSKDDAEHVKTQLAEQGYSAFTVNLN